MAVVAVGVTALLVNIMERKQEAREPFYRVVELNEDTVDTETWGKNFPLQYDGYSRTVDQVRTRPWAAPRPDSPRPERGSVGAKPQRARAPCTAADR